MSQTVFMMFWSAINIISLVIIGMVLVLLILLLVKKLRK